LNNPFLWPRSYSKLNFNQSFSSQNLRRKRKLKRKKPMERKNKTIELKFIEQRGDKLIFEFPFKELKLKIEVKE
jgi:hypothetical protein